MRLSPRAIHRLQELTAHHQYTLAEWMWALNRQARNDPERLELVALLLREVKSPTSGSSSKRKGE